jgi:ATP-dependent Zn protease
MVAEFGMSDQIGPLSFGHDDANAIWMAPKMSAKTAELIDKETTDLVNEAHERANTILTKNRDLLAKLSEVLIVVEVIDGDDLKAYANGERPIPDPSSLQPNGKRSAEHATPSPTPVGSAAPPMPRFDQ